MQPQLQRASASTAVWGTVTSALGLYFLLVGLKVLPPPGEQHAPAWIVGCAGLVFLLAGVAIVIQVVGRADTRGELALDAPRWARVAQHFTGLAIVFLFATIGTWVALFAEGPFTVTTSFSSEQPANPVVARTVFGIGAAITWAWFVALVRRSVRMLHGP